MEPSKVQKNPRVQRENIPQGEPRDIPNVQQPKDNFSSESLAKPSTVSKKVYLEKQQTRAQEALDRLLPFSGVSSAVIRVIDSPVVTCECQVYSFGCYIFVTTAFLDAIKEDRLLRGILAHELGHFFARDQHEADITGAAILARAKLNPNDLVMALKKLKTVPIISRPDFEPGLLKRSGGELDDLQERINQLKIFIKRRFSGGNFERE